MIKQCTCRNEFQDSRYGKQMRVHVTAGKKGEELRCTVCHQGNIFRKMASIIRAFDILPDAHPLKRGTK